MNLTPAQHQLAQVSLKDIMGSEGNSEKFTERVSDLASRIWSEFIDEEIAHLLTEEQLDMLGKLLEDEDTTEEDLSEFLNKCVPSFDEMYQEKILDNKAATVEGRVKQLRSLAAGESDKQQLLDDCKSLIEKGEWLEVQAVLATDFAEY